MITPHVHIFGIPVDKLDFKKDYLDMIQSQAGQLLPTKVGSL